MSKHVTIGNSSFNVEETQKLKFDEFEKIYKGKIFAKGKTLREVYDIATGKVKTDEEKAKEDPKKKEKPKAVPVKPEANKVEEPGEKK